MSGDLSCLLSSRLTPRIYVMTTTASSPSHCRRNLIRAQPLKECLPSENYLQHDGTAECATHGQRSIQMHCSESSTLTVSCSLAFLMCDCVHPADVRPNLLHVSVVSNVITSWKPRRARPSQHPHTSLSAADFEACRRSHCQNW